MTAVIDYGVGNLFSLCGSLRKAGAEVTVTADADTIRAAERLVLPGVGAFADAYRKLEETGLIPVIQSEAQAGKPILGICLGMQLLFDRSFEYGEHRGLGLIGGEIRPIAEALDTPLKVPHMGWNDLHFVRQTPLFRYVREGEYVYYVHSYHATRCEPALLATSDYGITITGAVSCGHVYGTQFHPEKSGETGLAILRAFLEL
ncbi:MAG: imidazole glycerol phosphate synthase subunit HisH [Eubacteriales bacterium]